MLNPASGTGGAKCLQRFKVQSSFWKAIQLVCLGRVQENKSLFVNLTNKVCNVFTGFNSLLNVSVPVHNDYYDSKVMKWMDAWMNKQV